MTRIALAVLAVAAVAAAAVVVARGSPTAEPARLRATLLRTYDAADAGQGVAVDRGHFFAVNDRAITEHSRASGAPLRRFAGARAARLIHMDSGAIRDGRLYVAHSNYDAAPMRSSVEVFDARTLEHVASHPLGIRRGSLTWIDRHRGSWWAGVGNYDVVPDGRTAPYGRTDNTRIVRMTDGFRVRATYTLPQAILDRFRPMSVSGGSWGPDGRLWITGHDRDEAYVMEPPKAGAELRWVATVELPGVEGQGIAWDRAAERPTLWAIRRSTTQVLRFDAPYRETAAARVPPA